MDITTTATTTITNDVTATATTTKLLHPTEDHPKADIFWSQDSIDMSAFKDIIFSSHIDTNDTNDDYDGDDDGDLETAAAAILTEEDLVNRSCDTTATTSGESSTLDGGADEEHELGEFLWDALAGFDPTVNDLADLCQTE